ncbi:hypothetical protein PtB15_13B536 [Puccinia triticina]|nr:hypothetical protein PtB15_13B536 [Puccinia triticina]
MPNTQRIQSVSIPEIGYTRNSPPGSITEPFVPIKDGVLMPTSVLMKKAAEMVRRVPILPLTRAAFEPYGAVIEAHLDGRASSNELRTKVVNFGTALKSDHTYLKDLQKRAEHPVSEKVFGGRILHALWIGINPIIAIWRSEIYGNQTHCDSDTFLDPKLVAQLDTQVEQFSQQLVELLTKPNISQCQADYMIMTIPPLTNTLLASMESSNAAKGNHTIAQHNRQLLGRLTDRFNTKLIEAIQRITPQFFEKRSRITVFDTEQLWNDVSSAPEKFGIKSLDACVTDPRKPPCKKPREHMYWDILHPSTALHESLSTAIMNFLGHLGY